MVELTILPLGSMIFYLQLQRFVKYFKEFVKCKEEPESKIQAVRSLWEEDVISLVT